MNDVELRGAARAGSVKCGIFGRDEALREVVGFVAAVSGGPAMLEIVGEPGAGKTTVWEYGVALARDAGHQILTIRATPEEQDSPGAALIDVFALDPSYVDPLPRVATPSFDQGRALLRSIRHVAAAAPVLLAVDDPHWLDTISANAIRFCLNRLGDERVGLLLTSSSAFDRQGCPIKIRGGQRIELGPLPLEALRRALVRSLAVVARPELGRAHELSNGNPGVALALVRSWQRERQGTGRVKGDSAVREQLDALPADAIALVRTLAIAGPVPVGVIAAAAEVEDFATAAAAAVDAGLVHVTDDLTMRFSEQHLAHAVAATTNPLQRCAIHARLVDAVTSPEARARHLALATLVADEAVAAQLEVVAAQCAQRGSYDRGAELVAHGARLTPPPLSDAAARRRSREVAYRAASGETARAVALADQLLADLGPGQRRAEVLTQRVFLDFSDSERFLRQALEDVDEDPPMRARILDLLGWQLGLYRGRLREGAALSTEALAISRGTGDNEASALAAATLATTSALRGIPREDLFDEALRREAALRLSPLGRWPRVFKARTLLWAGHLADARTTLAHMQKHAAALGSEFQRPYRLHDLATVSVAAGDLVEARERASEGIEAARDAGNEQAIAWLAHPYGVAAALQGDERAARWAAQLLSDWAATTDEAPRQTMAHEVLGNLAATQADWTAALHHFEAMAEKLATMGYAHPGARPALPRAIEAAAMAGETQRCRALAQQLAPQAAALRGAPLVDAQLRAARGQLALLEGDGDTAITLLNPAVDDFDQLGYRFEAARTRLPLARALLRCGQRARANTCATQARDLFAAVSAPEWAAAAATLVSRASTGASAGSLTRTELQIARRVAAGRTNREIANDLFISTSTVEAHLTRVYRKLDVRGRTQLTTWVHDCASSEALSDRTPAGLDARTVRSG